MSGGAGHARRAGTEAGATEPGMGECTEAVCPSAAREITGDLGTHATGDHARSRNLSPTQTPHRPHTDPTDPTQTPLIPSSGRVLVDVAEAPGCNPNKKHLRRNMRKMVMDWRSRWKNALWAPNMKQQLEAWIAPRRSSYVRHASPQSYANAR